MDAPMNPEAESKIPILDVAPTAAVTTAITAHHHLDTRKELLGTNYFASSEGVSIPSPGATALCERIPMPWRRRKDRMAKVGTAIVVLVNDRKVGFPVVV
jgi:hypothetical protein